LFGFEWSEIAVIAVVALICIGPKDMPVAIRAITRTIKKMRRMASEFQTHVDDMLRDADLHEVSDTIRDMRGMSMRGAITRAIDPDGSVTRSIADPFHDRPVPPASARPISPHPVAEHNVTEHMIPERPFLERRVPAAGPPPDFLPPSARPPATIQPPMPPWAMPDFVPPHQELGHQELGHHEPADPEQAAGRENT